MAVTIDATAKGASSNSYVTLSESNTYFESRYNAAKWNDSTVTDDDKNRALVTATNRLEQEEYDGSVTDLDQRLKWPRFNTYDTDGRLYDQDVIPEPVKQATYELADAILAGDLELKDTGLEAFESVSVGPISVTPRHARASGQLPENVIRLLAHLRLGGSGLNLRVERA